MRKNGRKADELRKIKFTRRFTDAPDGSVLVEFGRTMILCTAIVEEGVPPFLLNSGMGWVTAEYAMLPGASPQRKQRESRSGRADGRSIEIGRLVGRSLRSVTNMKYLGQRTIWVDCDVIRADGGTRTAAITGGYLALHDAVKKLSATASMKGWPLITSVAAISVGILDDEPVLDLDYAEDSRAEVDMNIVKTAQGDYIEIQGGAEKTPFSDVQMEALLKLGQKGIEDLIKLQNEALGVEAS